MRAEAAQQNFFHIFFVNTSYFKQNVRYSGNVHQLVSTFLCFLTERYSAGRMYVRMSIHAMPSLSTHFTTTFQYRDTI
jgi:hypothetical protein